MEVVGVRGASWVRLERMGLGRPRIGAFWPEVFAGGLLGLFALKVIDLAAASNKERNLEG